MGLSVFTAVSIALIVALAMLAAVAASARVPDPRQRWAVRAAGLAPLLSLLAAQLVGGGLALLLVAAGLVGVLAWVAQPDLVDRLRTSAEPRARWLARALQELAYGEPVSVHTGQFAVRADVVGALVGLAVAVTLVLLLV
jgi:hypothetical protein